MLYEIEQKVSYLSELSVHSESLLLEGRAETKGEAEQLTVKLRSLKDSLLELQQMLQDKQVDIQVRSAVICYFFTVSTFMAASTLHTPVYFHFPAFLPPCFFVFSFALLHYVELACDVNASIVQKVLKANSCAFIKVHCFPLWNSNSCVSHNGA